MCGSTMSSRPRPHPLADTHTMEFSTQDPFIFLGGRVLERNSAGYQLSFLFKSYNMQHFCFFLLNFWFSSEIVKQYAHIIYIIALMLEFLLLLKNIGWRSLKG